jgi:hypothetical protein
VRILLAEPRKTSAPPANLEVLKRLRAMNQNDLNERRTQMDQVTLIRIVACVLFVVVLGVLVQRRRTKVR